MKEYAKGFYKSKAWQKVSRLYMMSKNYICERCGGVGVICHHKKHLTPFNINNIEITLGENNLECLCQECHNQEHSARASRAIFDNEGRMIGVQDTNEIKNFKDSKKVIENLRKNWSDTK